MMRNRNKQLLIIGLLAFVIVAMTIGFALYSATLNMSGSVSVSASSWNVHFNVASPIQNSITASTGSQSVTVSALTGTSLTWSTTLSKPTDFAEFTINVVNEGTFDANLTGITIGGASTAQAKYIEYSITYNGTTYTSTNASISGVTLAKKSGTTATTAPVKVKVLYKQPTNASDLPSSAQSLTLTATLTFTQAS